MKTIKLRTLGNEGEEGVLDYKKMLKSIVQLPSDPRQGLSISDIRQAVRVLDGLEGNGAVLQLEDADYSFLKKKIENYKFGLAHKNILTFVDDVLNAQTPVEEKTK